ncbi:HCP-like protein, partial [Rhizophagus irregularis]
AFELYQKSADLGNATGIYNLGDCYEKGIGIDIDERKAFELYQKSADLGNTNGINNLGYCYEKGIGTDIYEKKALYQKSADLGNTNGINNLGYCYKQGIGTDIDEKKAFELYQKSADLGNATGIYNLGDCYEKGIGIDIDERKAFELYQKSADLGNTNGINNLGYCYEKGIGTDIYEKKALYQKSADLGNTNGINNLGYCYKQGIGTDIDEKKAFELYQKSADLGNATGIYNLGDCYEKGIGTDINEKSAFELYQKSADLGNANGISNLGYCYEHGIGTDIDEKKAFELYQKAADLGNIAAQYNLAFMYEYIVKDINQAIYWYKRSALQGDQDAQNRLEQIHAILYIKVIALFAQYWSLIALKDLFKIAKFKWQDRLQLLKNIVSGLKVIHESNLTHGDFHDGNILISDDYKESFIIDLGLCKPISDLQDPNNEIYGVLPYVAPEILRGNPYIQASDIYSLSMIMWEFTSGIPPFNHEAHEHDLILRIRQEEERPKIVKSTPELQTSNNQLKNDVLEFLEAKIVQEQANTSIMQSHPKAYYTSRNLTEILFQENSDREESNQGYELMIV